MYNKGCPSERIVLFFQHCFEGVLGKPMLKIYVANYVHPTLSSFNATDTHLLVKKVSQKICNINPINKEGGLNGSLHDIKNTLFVQKGFPNNEK